MKICVLSDVSGHGGAAMIANGLATEWARHDGVSRRYMTMHTGDINPHAAIPRNRIFNFVLHGHGKTYLGPVARHVSHSLVSSELASLQPDIISLHNIHASNENHALVAACAEIAPTVWTLHDMWSFTGRCGYSYWCDKFVSGCDASCPSPHFRPALQPSKISESWNEKRRFFESTSNIVGVSPSQWLASLAKRGLWQHHRMELIHNGVDTNVFRPISQDSARESLGLATNGFVVTVYVGHKGDPFKTPELLEAALNLIKTPLHVLSFGPGSLDLPDWHKITALGSIGNPIFLSIAYSCGNIFVLPSSQENFPTVILEAAACGVPTVAFDVGGNSEIVKEGETGWLAKNMSANALAETIISALENTKNDACIREQCRQVAIENFNVSVQASHYQSLFKELTGKN